MTRNAVRMAALFGALPFLAAPRGAAQETAPADSARLSLDAWLSRQEADSDERFPDAVPRTSGAEADSLFAEWLRTGAAPAAARRASDAPGTVRMETGIASVRYDRVGGANVTGRIRFRVMAPLAPTLAVETGRAWAARRFTGKGSLSLGRRSAASADVTWGRTMPAYGDAGPPGNTVAALVAGEDWSDWMEEEGWRANLRRSARGVTVRAGWMALRQRSLPVRTQFALLDRDPAFRANPPIDDGRLRRMELEVTAGEPRESRWSGSVLLVQAGEGLGGDLEYRGIHGEILGRRSPGRGDELQVRLSAGAVSTGAPRQALPLLGGTRTLRGFAVNEVAFPRYVHLGLDYLVGTDLLRPLPGIGHLRLQLVPFLDAAHRLGDEAPTAAPLPDPPDWPSSTGLGVRYNALGIPGGEGQLRVDVAKRFDRGHEDWTVRAGVTWAR